MKRYARAKNPLGRPTKVNVEKYSKELMKNHSPLGALSLASHANNSCKKLAQEPHNIPSYFDPAQTKKTWSFWGQVYNYINKRVRKDA
jgi:hypothetical protein